MRPETFDPRVLLLLVLWLAVLCPTLADASAPQRIVSCGPTVTEKLYLLGLEDRVAGVTTYCVRPPGAQKKPKIGNVTQISVEKVVSLKPDLVIATALTDPRTVRKLREQGIGVALFGDPKSFAEMNRQFIELGRLTGREKEAREMVGVAEKKVETIRAGTRGLSKPRVFLQIGASPLFTASKDSFLQDFVEFAGGTNMVKERGDGLYSRERVITENPDIILIVAMEGRAAEQEKAKWEKFGTLKAVVNHRVYVIDPYKMCSPTPVTFVEALETVAGLMHPGWRKEAGR